MESGVAGYTQVWVVTPVHYILNPLDARHCLHYVYDKSPVCHIYSYRRAWRIVRPGKGIMKWLKPIQKRQWCWCRVLRDQSLLALFCGIDSFLPSEYSFIALYIPATVWSELLTGWRTILVNAGLKSSGGVTHQIYINNIKSYFLSKWPFCLSGSGNRLMMSYKNPDHVLLMSIWYSITSWGNP